MSNSKPRDTGAAGLGVPTQMESRQMSGIQFVALQGEASASERLQHIAIQATAVMLQKWFEDEEPTPEKAKQMVGAVMDALTRPNPGGPSAP